MNRLWALQILYWRALFIRLFRDSPIMPVLDSCPGQTLDSSTSCGSEPMACDKLVILHHDHIGSLCVSDHCNAGPEPAKVGALFASASTSKKTNAPSEGVSGGSIPIHRSCQSNPQRGNRWSDTKLVLCNLTITVGPRPSPKASFWHVKQVDLAWDDLGLGARIGILPSSGSCTIGVASDSGGCTDSHLNSPALRIELSTPNRIPRFEPSVHQKVRYVNHILMQTSRELHTLRLYLGDLRSSTHNASAADKLVVILPALPKLQYSHDFRFNYCAIPRARSLLP
jgi:hypothetical protein